MAWPKGKPRPPGAGRKKGTPNKLTASFREELAKFEDGKGFDSVKEMLEIFTTIKFDNPMAAAKIGLAVWDRLYPAIKGIEMKSNMNVEPFILEVGDKTLEFKPNPEPDEAS